MKKTVIIQPDGRNLLEILTGQFYELPSFCSGRGTCGKCKVRVRKEGEKSDGLVVLACQYVPVECCQVEFLQEEGEYSIEIGIGGSGEALQKKEIKKEIKKRMEEKNREEERNRKEKWNVKEKQNTKEESKFIENEKESRQIVVDIGTTTLAMLLLNKQGEVLSSWTGLNPQRKYGADVISRIERANKGQKQELTDCIRRAVLTGMEFLCGVEENRIRAEKREGEKKEEENRKRKESRALKENRKGLQKQRVSRVVIAGNTTMQHLFAGYSVEELGAYPFSVAQKDLVVGKLAKLYPMLPEMLSDAEYVLMPCMSAFVGGDIMAGMLEVERQQAENIRRVEETSENLLFANSKQTTTEEEASESSHFVNSKRITTGENSENSHFANSKRMTTEEEASESPIFANYRRVTAKEKTSESWLLLDIGTNGEMVLYSEGVYYTASTAAGPVFEGGNIRCGIGSIAGAIDHVWEANGELEYSTIGGYIPVGICGTGLIESMAALRRMGILNRDGLLVGYSENGYVLARGGNGDIIRITQEDVRQFQLAKAAIRSGIEILCRTARITIQKLGCIYLAGGFGTKLDVKKSCEVGLLPTVSQNRYKGLGNAALSGCRVYCMEKMAVEQLRKIQESGREVTLALEDEFQKQYLEYMCF